MLLGKESLRNGFLLSMLGAGALAACAGAPPPPAKAEAPPELPKLMDARTSMQKEWASKDEGIKSRCEMSDGDCMLEVRDQRFELLSIRSFPECDKAKAEERDLCEEKSAVDQGLGQEIANLYTFHNKCMSQMLACTARLEADAKEKAIVERAQNRLVLIEANGKGESARVDAVTAKEGADYLRSTLPPTEEGACKDMAEVKSCLSATKQQEQDLRSELRKEDDSYNEEYAASVYQETRLAQAKCYEPEYSCLTARAQRYGDTPESVKAFKRNIEVLKTRERLGMRVSPEVFEQCKTSEATKHQGNIVSAYTTYAKQPVLFFRKKLHQAFFELYQGQVACLRGQPPVEKSAPAPKPAPKPPAVEPEPKSSEPEHPILQAKR